MYTGDVWGVTLIALGLIAVTTAFQILMTAVFSGAIESARTTVASSPWASFGLGVATLAVLAIVAVLFAKVPELGPVLAAVHGTAVILLALFGWTAASRSIGERMTSPANAPWRATLRGAITTGLVALIPGLGWFLVFPVVLAIGTGGVMLAGLRGRQVVPHTTAQAA